MHMLLSGFNVLLMVDVFGRLRNTHMRSSWQCLNGANNRLDSLAWIQEPQFSLFAPKECLLSLSHVYNEFLFCGLHEMVKFCSKSIIIWSSCFAFLVWGHSRDRKTFPKIENWLQEQAFSMHWIMNVLNLPNPPSSSPFLSLQALCYSCWCLNVLLCRSWWIFDRSQQDERFYPLTTGFNSCKESQTPYHSLLLWSWS